MLQRCARIPAALAAGWLTALAAGPVAARGAVAVERPAGEDCVLRSIEVADEGADALLELSIDGSPDSLGARVEGDRRVVLDLAGCLLAPGITGGAFDHGLVVSVEIAHPSEDDGSPTQVAVAARRPFDYTVRSGGGLVRVRLQPMPEDGEADTRRLVEVLEPLPVAPLAPLAPAPEPARVSAVEEVRTRVSRWARAWSDQRAGDYLAAYAPGFRPSDGASRDAWEQQRRQRLTVPGFIVVSLEELEVRLLEPGTAEASFWQTYDSDRYSDRVYKSQTWVRLDGDWKILREDVVPPPGPS